LFFEGGQRNTVANVAEHAEETRLTVRRASAADAPALRAIWLEAAQAFVKADRHYRLAPGGADEWQMALETWLGRPEVAVFVAERGGKVLGYIVAALAQNQPGLLPANYGFVSDLAVDFHAKTGGVGRALLDAVKGWFRSGGITRIEARVPARNAVAQAFWRAVGAHKTYEQMWLRADGED
jgi:GNAT superfamily N-acetyltransferase